MACPEWVQSESEMTKGSCQKKCLDYHMLMRTGSVLKKGLACAGHGFYWMFSGSGEEVNPMRKRLGCHGIDIW